MQARGVAGQACSARVAIRRHHSGAPQNAPGRVPKTPMATATPTAIGAGVARGANVGHQPLTDVDLGRQDGEGPRPAAHATTANVAPPRGDAVLPTKSPRATSPGGRAVGAVIAITIVGVEASSGHQGQEGAVRPARDTPKDAHQSMAIFYAPTSLIKTPVAP